MGKAVTVRHKKNKIIITVDNEQSAKKNTAANSGFAQAGLTSS
jgi:hypothetical protein